MARRKTIRDYLEGKEEFSEFGKNKIYFTGRFPLYLIAEPVGGASKYSIRNQWKRFGKEAMILITICGPHKYLPGFTGGITLEVILNDIEVTPEEIKAEKRKGQQTWDEMPENKKKEHLQFIYDMGSKIEEEDIKKYRIKTIY